jgi:hypothetical protein
MTIERLREQLQYEPFRRFTMHLADGRDIEVHHREFIAVSSSGRTAVVFQPDDRMNIIDLLLVTDLEVLPETKKRKNGNGRGKH